MAKNPVIYQRDTATGDFNNADNFAPAPAVKITLRGRGGELDCRVVTPTESTFEAEVGGAVMDIATNCVLAVGDTITIEEVEG